MGTSEIVSVRLNTLLHWRSLQGFCGKDTENFSWCQGREIGVAAFY